MRDGIVETSFLRNREPKGAGMPAASTGLTPSAKFIASITSSNLLRLDRHLMILCASHLERKFVTLHDGSNLAR